MTEEQPFEVVRRYEGFELRRYPSHVVAEVTVELPFEKAGNAAFRYLFGYLTGQNRSRTSVAMTAPVIQSAGAAQKVAMTAPVIQYSTKEGGYAAGPDPRSRPRPMLGAIPLPRSRADRCVVRARAAVTACHPDFDRDHPVRASDLALLHRKQRFLPTTGRACGRRVSWDAPRPKRRLTDHATNQTLSLPDPNSPPTATSESRGQGVDPGILSRDSIPATGDPGPASLWRRCPSHCPPPRASRRALTSGITALRRGSYSPTTKSVAQ